MSSLSKNIHPAIQLVDAYLYEARLERAGPDPDIGAPTFDIADARVLRHDEDEGGFSVVLEGRVRFPFNDNRAMASLDASVGGNFQSPETLSDEDIEAFARTSAIVILYPYLRSIFGQLWRSTGIEAPPLPTIDAQALLHALQEEAEETEQAKRKPAKRTGGRKRGVSSA